MLIFLNIFNLSEKLFNMKKISKETYVRLSTDYSWTYVQVVEMQTYNKVLYNHPAWFKIVKKGKARRKDHNIDYRISSSITAVENQLSRRWI